MQSKICFPLSLNWISGILLKIYQLCDVSRIIQACLCVCVCVFPFCALFANPLDQKLLQNQLQSGIQDTSAPSIWLMRALLWSATQRQISL